MMASYAGKLNATFCNAAVYNYKINAINDGYDVTRIGSLTKEYISLGRRATIGMELIADDAVALYLSSLLGITSTSRHIGPAAHCQFCNRTYLPGTLTCLGCGAPTNYNPRAIEYKGAAAILVSMSYSGNAISDLATIYVDLEMPDYKYTPALFSHDLSWLVDDHPNTWLCGFCGLYVNESKTSCPGCGGYRVPEKVLQSLERECVYCGRYARGGYVCDDCNGRLALREKQWQ